MEFMQIAEIAALVVGVGSISVSGILWKVIDAQRVRIESLEDETKACNANHIENIAKIKELEGQVAAFKDVPLKEIAKTQKDILHTQKEILAFVKQIKEK